MADSSCDGHVGYIVWPRIIRSRENPGMPSQYLMCPPEVAISQRIHLWEGKSASNQPCESSNASPNRYEQEPCVLVALWMRVDVASAGSFLEHVCPAVDCPGRNSRRLDPGWCQRSIDERRNWLFPLGHATVQGSWVFSRSPGPHRQEMFCCNPCWHVGSWSQQHTEWTVGTLGWPSVWIARVEVCSRDEHWTGLGSDWIRTMTNFLILDWIRTVKRFIKLWSGSDLDWVNGKELRNFCVKSLISCILLIFWTVILNFLCFLDYGWTWTEFLKFKTGSGLQN